MKKGRTGDLIPCGPSSNSPAYCLLGLLAPGFDSGFPSGLLAAGGFDLPCSPAFACETSNIRVPPSRCTFFPAEVITEPCVAFEPAALRFKPFNPNTPWLFEASCAAAFKPPTAPVNAPTAPPAVDVTPPNAPRPLAMPEPAAEAPMPPMVSMSAPAADVPLSAA